MGNNRALRERHPPTGDLRGELQGKLVIVLVGWLVGIELIELPLRHYFPSTGGNPTSHEFRFATYKQNIRQRLLDRYCFPSLTFSPFGWSSGVPECPSASPPELGSFEPQSSHANVLKRGPLRKISVAT